MLINKRVQPFEICIDSHLAAKTKNTNHLRLVFFEFGLDVGDQIMHQRKIKLSRKNAWCYFMIELRIGATFLFWLVWMMKQVLLKTLLKILRIKRFDGRDFPIFLLLRVVIAKLNLVADFFAEKASSGFGKVGDPTFFRVAIPCA